MTTQGGVSLPVFGCLFSFGDPRFRVRVLVLLLGGPIYVGYYIYCYCRAYIWSWREKGGGGGEPVYSNGSRLRVCVWRGCG